MFEAYFGHSLHILKTDFVFFTDFYRFFCAFFRILQTLIQAITDEVDDANNEAKNAKDKAVKAISDATIMSEELRKEQDQSSHIERARKALDTMVKDLQVRLDETEHQALKDRVETVR